MRQWSLLVILLATVNSCARRFFRHFRRKSLWWFCKSTLVRCLSDEQSVAELCWYLAHYPGSKPDHQLHRFYQQHAQCVGDRCLGPIAYQQYSFVNFMDKFLQTTIRPLFVRKHYHHVSHISRQFLPNSLVYLLLKLVHKVKCYFKSAKGSRFYETLRTFLQEMWRMLFVQGGTQKVEQWEHVHYT